MKLFSDRTYRVLRWIAHMLMRVAHPVVRIHGRENVPEGAAVVAANHSAFSDVIWVHVAMKTKTIPMTMAKKELFGVFLLGKLFRKVGAFPVDREGNDIKAVKTSLKCLHDNNKLVIFPEGTRVRRGKTSNAHSGAMLLACRADAPVLPVYLTMKKRPFCPIDVIIGKPYKPSYEGAKPTGEELEHLTAEMMRTIYQMGDVR